MVGIVSYGAYVPLRRLGQGTQGWRAPGEKAIAYYDEDSLTMAVAAAIDCLGTIDRQTVDGFYFASTTSPYKEKLAATTAASTSTASQRPRRICDENRGAVERRSVCVRHSCNTTMG